VTVPAAGAPLRCPRVEMAPGGPMVSEVICGAMRFNGTPEETLVVVKELLTIGVTTFDVAAVYGGGEHVRGVEHRLGAALALEPGLREQLEIVTKCGITSVDGQGLYDNSTEHILASADKSLAALQTSYIDVFLIHRPDPTMDADAVAVAFRELKRNSKVRSFGVSNFTPSQIELLQSRLGNEILLVTNQLEISCIETKLLSSPFGNGTLDQCQLARQRPMAWGPLNKLMAGRGPNEQVGRVLETVQTVAAELGLPDPEGDAAVTAVAVAWLALLPCKPLVVTGSTKVERIAQAVAGLSVPLTRRQWFAILQASRGAGVP
jgi:predicted oxidoreductase